MKKSIWMMLLLVAAVVAFGVTTSVVNAADAAKCATCHNGKMRPSIKGKTYADYKAAESKHVPAHQGLTEAQWPDTQK